MPVPMVKQPDYLAKEYRHLAEGDKIGVGEFDGTVYSYRPDTIDKFCEGLRFGKYLELQGYTRHVVIHDTLVFKVLWYLSTRDAGLTALPSDEREYVFGMEVTRRFLHLATKAEDFDYLEIARKDACAAGEKFFASAKRAIDSFLTERGTIPLGDGLGESTLLSSPASERAEIADKAVARARVIAQKIALDTGTVTGARVLKSLRDENFPDLDQIDPRFMGQVFKEERWEKAGTSSEPGSHGSHGRPVTVWRLRG